LQRLILLICGVSSEADSTAADVKENKKTWQAGNSHLFLQKLSAHTKLGPTMHILRFLVAAVIAVSIAACNGNEKPVIPADITSAPTASVDTFDLDGFKASYENTDRVVWQRPNLIIGLLGNGTLDNKVVVDIGAGTGFFAKRVTPLAKKVIALDIDESFLRLIDRTKMLELPADLQSHLETRLTPRDAPNLAPNEADAVLIVNTFMYIENKLEYLQKLKPCIKEGGRLVIVDFKRKRTALGPLPREHRAPLYVVEDLLYEAGYRNIQAIDTELDYQYILIAER
jgi:2-polyprenyl-3-methyl-5-hydroxy-6-metoxy-1,4-benzoquinol methylase